MLNHVQDPASCRGHASSDHQEDKAGSNGMKLLQATSHRKATVLLINSPIICNKPTFLLDLKIIGFRPEVALGGGADV